MAFRTLVESEEYKDQIEKHGDAEGIDEALRALLWSLSIRPEVWPIISGYKRLRLAWTDSPGGPAKRRAWQIWFEIRNGDYVDLLYLEPLDPER